VVNGLTFVSAFSSYPVDSWPPGDPFYGESTQHLYASGDYVFSQAASISLKAGVVNFNDPLHGGAPNMLTVANIDGAGAITSTANSWTFSGDFGIDDWVDGGVTTVRLLTASGTPNPPYPPGASGGLALYVNRSGHLFALGQVPTHTESTGVLYGGGALTVQVEVTPGGLWYLQAFAGAAGGDLAYTACGDAWAAGALYAASFGEGASAAGGMLDMPLVTTTTATGTMGSRVGPATCPHPPPPAWGGRGQVFWVR
jgi:hypothetical protein